MSSRDLEWGGSGEQKQREEKHDFNAKQGDPRWAQTHLALLNLAN